MMTPENKKVLTQKFREAINCESVDNTLNTPDYVLAEMLVEYLDTVGKTIKERDRWFDFKPFGRQAMSLESDGGAFPTGDTEETFSP